MQNAIAFSDNDVVLVAWSYGQRLDGCMGFAVYRIDPAGTETALPSMAVFPGFKRKTGQTTAQFPIQKFYWKDPYARLVADKTGQRRFRYKIVPLEGQPGKLVPMTLAFAVSNEVEVSPVVTPKLRAFFNRGLISTQHTSQALQGAPSSSKLLDLIRQPDGALRKSLAGDMTEALLGFVQRARSSGKLYAALYELGDEELIAALEAVGKRLNLVLSNPASSDKQSASAISDGNDESRRRLRQTAGRLLDRMLPGNQIGHNKFVVYVGASGHASAVLLGSTNWTSTGLCAQTNNTLVIDDAAIAKRYLDAWHQLADDTLAAGPNPKSLQGAALRTFDAKSKVLKLGTAATLTSWFSPNTPKLRRSNTKDETRPPDMDEVARLIAGAKHAVLFLAFYPGSPGIANWAAAAQKADKGLFVRGCVTNPSAAVDFHYDLIGVTPPKRKPGDPPGSQDPRVIQAMALTDTIPAGWKKEILAAGFAVTHDKIVVVDPFSTDCAVVTGSHNLGHKASFNNDENLVIVRGERRLAEAYATHVLDVYDHFSWRWNVQRYGQPKADTMLEVDPAAWQSRYFDAAGRIKVAQLKFWLSALPSVAAPAWHR
ncbi:MAG: phospholipase D-like domain-containing protein [Caldimonas sp.]